MPEKVSKSPENLKKCQNFDFLTQTNPFFKIRPFLMIWKIADFSLFWRFCPKISTLRKKNYQFFSDSWTFSMFSTTLFTSLQILKKYSFNKNCIMFNKFCTSFDKNCIMFNKFCIVFDKNCIMFDKFCKKFNENCLTFNKICKKIINFLQKKKKFGQYLNQGPPCYQVMCLTPRPLRIGWNRIGKFETYVIV